MGDTLQIVLTPLGWTPSNCFDVAWSVYDLEHSEMRDHGHVLGRPYQTALAVFVLALHRAYATVPGYHS